MRKITFLLAFCFTTFVASAQVTTVLSGLNFPYGIAIDGSDLYIAAYSSDQIYKADLTLTNPTTESFLPLAGAGPLWIDGNTLYAGSLLSGQLYEADLSASSPLLEQIVDLPSRCAGLYKEGDILYVATEASNTIVKLDLSVSNPTPETILNTGLSVPAGITGSGDILYVSNFGNGSIIKLDISQPNPTPVTLVSPGSGLIQPFGLTLNGNFLYIAHYGKVSRIDVTQTNPTIEDIVTSGLSDPRNTVFDGTTIYITESGSGEVSKLVINDPVFSTLPAVCEGSTNAQLGGASPTGGVYSGNSVTDNGDGQHFTFDAVAAGGVGSYTVTYTINGFSTTATVEVTALPTVTFSLADTLYMTAAMPLTGLGGGMPTGGVYTDAYSEINDDGNGMTFSFNSSVYVDDINYITYTYTDANGCQNSVTELVYVSSAVSGVLKLSDLQASLFPNPTYGPAVWSGVEAKFVRVLNQEGRQVLAQKITKQEVDLSSLPNGIYSLLLQLDNDQWVRAQVVKQ
ncbi:MAG: T9SS type A sorting domain-containing protein [Saprospiraceae bacterium]